VRRRGGPVDPAEALLRRTRTRLALLTLLTVTTLVIVIGVTTAVTAITLMRESVDRALLLAAGDPLVLHQLFDGEGEDSSVQGALGDADTFVILASADGTLLGASGARPEGLPDGAAIAAAERGRDLRDTRFGDTEVRLLTMRVAGETSEDHEGGEDDEERAAAAPTRFLQAGMNMALQHRLERQLLLAILVIGTLGVLGAMIVTLFVTQRALVPIREAFATERRFVAAASHELRTPVAIIRASAEILERERLVASGGSSLLEDILGETDRLGRLVGDLLALASAEAGALALDLAPVDLGAWFADLGRRSGAIAASRGVRLAVSPPGVVPGLAVTADGDRLDQLVLILVDNAIAHSPPGGLVRLDLIEDRRAGRAVVRVRDEGPGIPIEEQERIFEPFARVRGTRRVSGGSGLGLAIASQLAGRQGADLSVVSSPGQGATFSLTLRLG
jgi:signal transduction histidine kinase